jgi:hypothetical protein
MGKKSTPSVGWEVPLRSHRSTSESWTERVQDNESKMSHLNTVCMHLFLNGRLILFLRFYYCTSLCKYYVLLNML